MNFQPEKALKHRLVMLSGDEEAWRQQALHELLVAAQIEKDDFDLATMSADESSPMAWFAAAGTSPFLAERRTVIVRHLLRCEVDKIGTTNFAKLPEFAFVILVADDESGDENRQQRLKTVRKNWEKAVTNAGGAAFVMDSDPKVIKDSLKRELVKMGKGISESALSALIDMTGGNFSRALGELQKIEIFVGDQPQIRESDVRDVVMPSREWNVYRMVESVFQGQMPEALRQLRVLMGSSTKAEDAAFSRIMPTVSRHLRLLWQARACVEANLSNPSFVPDGVPKFLTEKNPLSKEAPYRVNPLLATAKRLSFAQIERCFAIVADTDARLKGSLNSFSALDTLERMLLEMSEAVSVSAGGR